MAGTTEYGMPRIAERAFQRLPAQSAIGFHVPDRRFDGAAPFNHRFQAAGDATPLT